MSAIILARSLQEGDQGGFVFIQFAGQMNPTSHPAPHFYFVNFYNYDHYIPNLNLNLSVDLRCAKCKWALRCSDGSDPYLPVFEFTVVVLMIQRSVSE